MGLCVRFLASSKSHYHTSTTSRWQFSQWTNGETRYVGFLGGFTQSYGSKVATHAWWDNSIVWSRSCDRSTHWPAAGQCLSLITWSRSYRLYITRVGACRSIRRITQTSFVNKRVFSRADISLSSVSSLSEYVRRVLIYCKPRAFGAPFSFWAQTLLLRLCDARHIHISPKI